VFAGDTGLSDENPRLTGRARIPPNLIWRCGRQGLRLKFW